MGPSSEAIHLDNTKVNALASPMKTSVVVVILASWHCTTSETARRLSAALQGQSVVWPPDVMSYGGAAWHHGMHHLNRPTCGH